MITIEPLSEETLADATHLGQRVFVNDDPARISSVLQNSFHSDKEGFLKTHQFVSMQYWVARENDRVVGAVGCYLSAEDAYEAAWLGWFFVDPEWRGQKIGLRLLDTVVQAVKKAGKNYLRLYSSSDDPLEKPAHRLYAQYGFLPFREPGYNIHQKGQVIYLQLDLNIINSR